LFRDLLDSNHLILHYDMQDRPDLYGEVAKQLVSALTAGQRQYGDLTDSERNELDVAALEYAARPPVRSHEKKRTAMLERVASIMTEPARDPSAPEGQLASFWWLR